MDHLRPRRQHRPSVHVGQLGCGGCVPLQRHLLTAGILSRVRGLRDGNLHCETQNPPYGNIHCSRDKDHVCEVQLSIGNTVLTPLWGCLLTLSRSGHESRQHMLSICLACTSKMCVVQEEGEVA